jgi:hypothetical protein
MQRSSGVVPSALKPPRPPSKNKTVPIAAIIQKDSCFVDEKGDKVVWWISNAETAVHLVPVVLLTCILILYICSSAQFLEYEMLSDETSQNVVEMTMMTERHLQQAVSSKLQAEEQTLSRDVFPLGILEKTNMDLQDHPSDPPANPLMLRGFAS